VLLTNDGDLAQVLLHPSFGSEREYRVTVSGRIVPATLRRLAQGVELEDGTTAPAEVGSASYSAARDTSRFALTLVEGKKRQIRRALAALNHRVVALRRVRMGPLRIGHLASGEARPLTPREIAALRRDLEHRRKAAAATPGERQR